VTGITPIKNQILPGGARGALPLNIHRGCRGAIKVGEDCAIKVGIMGVTLLFHLRG
jgi:hypothetical protein